jgi:hypothetical protein
MRSADARGASERADACCNWTDVGKRCRVDQRPTVHLRALREAGGGVQRVRPRPALLLQRMQLAGPACLAAPGGVPLPKQPRGTRGPCAACAALSPAVAMGAVAARTAGACTAATATATGVITFVARKFRDASVFPSRARG